MYILAPEQIKVDVHGHTSVFLQLFAKGNNFCDFLYGSLGKGCFPKTSLLFKERIRSNMNCDWVRELGYNVNMRCGKME